jgi:GDP dissociation inhibitor
MAEETVIPPVDFNGKTYKPLADGKYDCIILGTGLKECIMSGLLSMKGKKVRRYYRRYPRVVILGKLPLP